MTLLGEALCPRRGVSLVPLDGGIPRGAGHLDTLVADLFADLVATVRQQEAATETGQEGEPR
jgi:hypothetical protein